MDVEVAHYFIILSTVDGRLLNRATGVRRRGAPVIGRDTSDIHILQGAGRPRRETLDKE